VHFKLNKMRGSDDLIEKLHMLLLKRKGTVRRRRRQQRARVLRVL
jgi:hypothetical protein